MTAMLSDTTMLMPDPMVLFQFVKVAFSSSLTNTGCRLAPHIHQAGARRRAPLLWIMSVFLCVSVCLPVDSEAGRKTSRIPRPEPELKIVDLNVGPTPFEPGNGPLHFSVTVQLPRELDGATILEVTSLISSPSKTSLRFLTHRRPVEVRPAEDRAADRPRLSVELSWDGQDHRKQPAGSGMYSYEVRTKLLANGDKGLRTIMVAWPKRGTLEVK